MGRTAKFFRSLLGSKKSPSDSAASLSREKKKNSSSSSSKWPLEKSNKNEDPLASPYADGGLDANKHAIAVAAATAAVAEAALAAAQAAAEVVRLTSGGGSGSGRNVPAYVTTERRRVAAAIIIQSAFRAYLAKRALRALKGLVKLQALVRGHIVRKQSADMLRRMQAMARIQARASATRSYVKGNIKFSHYHPSGAANPRNYHHRSDIAHTTQQSRPSNKESSQMASNWLNHWMEQHSWNNRHATSPSTSRGDDERSTKILEIDTWKPRPPTRQSEKPNPSISSEDVLSAKEVEQLALWTAESSPKQHSASSRPTSNQRGAWTPTRSVLSDYLSHPSYMANTESSRAKVRSQSAPKQRMQLDELGRNAWESDAMSDKGYALPTTYITNAYLKRQGAPNGLRFSYGHRF